MLECVSLTLLHPQNSIMIEDNKQHQPRLFVGSPMDKLTNSHGLSATLGTEAANHGVLTLHEANLESL